MTIKTSQGNITATKSTLNYLSLYLGEAARGLRGKDLQGMADSAAKVSKEIYEMLKKSGFYND